MLIKKIVIYWRKKLISWKFKRKNLKFRNEMWIIWNESRKLRKYDKCKRIKIDWKINWNLKFKLEISLRTGKI